MKSFRHRRSRAGFSLVEVAIALGIFAFCIAALLGTIITGMSVSRDTIGNQVAVNIASSIANDLRVTPPYAVGPAYSPRFYISNQKVGGTTVGPLYFDGSGNLLPGVAGAVYQATLNFKNIPPNGAYNVPADFADIIVAWPAAAAHPTGTYETLVKSPE